RRKLSGPREFSRHGRLFASLIKQAEHSIGSVADENRVSGVERDPRSALNGLPTDDARRVDERVAAVRVASRKLDRVHRGFSARPRHWSPGMSGMSGLLRPCTSTNRRPFHRRRVLSHTPAIRTRTSYHPTRTGFVGQSIQGVSFSAGIASVLLREPPL